MWLLVRSARYLPRSEKPIYSLENRPPAAIGHPKLLEFREFETSFGWARDTGGASRAVQKEKPVGSVLAEESADTHFPGTPSTKSPNIFHAGDSSVDSIGFCYIGP